MATYTGVRDITISNATLRFNYREVVNESAGTSTVTITSVQAKVPVSGTLTPWGYVSFNDDVYVEFGENARTSCTAGTYTTLYYSGTMSGTFTNNGVNSTAGIQLIAGPTISAFRFLLETSTSQQVYDFSPGVYYISLTNYTTDSYSTLSAPTGVVLGEDITATITVKNTSYTHTLQYSWDNASWTNIVTGLKTSGSSTQIVYAWDTDNVASYFERTTGATCYIRCLSYNGSSYIGSAQVSVVISSSGNPVISDIVITPVNDDPTVNSWNNGDIFVQGYTRVQIQPQFTLAAGATLAACKIYISGMQVAEYGSEASSFVYTSSSPMTDYGTVEISALILDSRNNSTTARKSISIYAYSRPYVTDQEVFRSGNDASTKDDDGLYISAKGSVKYSYVGGYNTPGLKVRYKEPGGTWSSAVDFGSGTSTYTHINSSLCSVDKTYIVQFLAYDSLHTLENDPSTYEVTLATNAVLIHAADGGKGIAFGGYNNIEAIQNWLDTYLYGKLILPSGMYNTTEPSTTGAVVGQIYFQLID